MLALLAYKLVVVGREMESSRSAVHSLKAVSSSKKVLAVSPASKSPAILSRSVSPSLLSWAAAAISVAASH